jgi:hypothetical protein
LAEISILGVGGAESVAGGVVLLMSGKWTVLSQKSDLEGKQDTCGMLRAKVYKIGMGWVFGFHCKKIQN